jgi:hypothetical protein
VLLAEIRGKTLKEALNDEDYLTSEIFGHLRYVPPSVFWQSVLSKAKNLPLTGAAESLANVLAGDGHNISEYSRLVIHFWPYHAKFGEPDAILVFEETGLTPLVIVLEVKLNALKSSTGELDQLGKYLDLLENLDALSVRLPPSKLKVVIYLTLLDSRQEIRETLSSRGNRASDMRRLFRLRWQDICDCAESGAVLSKALPKVVLQDVAAFLKGRGYDFFDGFRQDENLPILNESDGAFYIRGSLFREVESLASITEVQRLLSS